MQRVNASCTGLLALLLSCSFACHSGLRSKEHGLLERLKQSEKEEGWRILVHTWKGVYYFDIPTAIFTPLYMAPSDTRDASYVGMASFSPDGTKITLAQNWGEHQRALMVFDLIERKNDPLLTMPYLEGPRWSPGSDEIAFQGRLEDTGNYSLYAYHLKDHQLSLIVSQEFRQGGFLFCWGPDGETVAYEDAGGAIWTKNLETGKRERIGKGWFPTWSPNGRYLAFQSDAPGDSGYFVYDLQTGKKRLILAGEPVLGNLVWSPDSHYLAYSKVSRGFWEYVVAFLGDEHYGDIFIMDVESNVEVNVYRGSGSVFPSDWAKTSALR